MVTLSNLKESINNKKKKGIKPAKVFIGYGANGLSSDIHEMIYDFMKNTKFDFGDEETEEGFMSTLEDRTTHLLLLYTTDAVFIELNGVIHCTENVDELYKPAINEGTFFLKKYKCIPLCACLFHMSP